MYWVPAVDGAFIGPERVNVGVVESTYTVFVTEAVLPAASDALNDSGRAPCPYWSTSIVLAIPGAAH
jgi:hypothetical protein